MVVTYTSFTSNALVKGYFGLDEDLVVINFDSTEELLLEDTIRHIYLSEENDKENFILSKDMTGIRILFLENTIILARRYVKTLEKEINKVVGTEDFEIELVSDY